MSALAPANVSPKLLLNLQRDLMRDAKSGGFGPRPESPPFSCGIYYVFPKFQSFGRPPILVIPALTVLILTMDTVANAPITHLQRSSTANRKSSSLGASANAAAVSICLDMTRLSASEPQNMLAESTYAIIHPPEHRSYGTRRRFPSLWANAVRHGLGRRR